ncbi:MAG: hypothetical protein Kow0062_06960 [Acidobacteriota bacterium]
MAEDAADRGQVVPVEVRIGDRTFRLRSDDPEGVLRIAERVDDAVRAVAPGGTDLEDPRVALLAALNVAGEDEELRRAWSERTAELAARVRDLAERVEQARARIAASARPV